jgi:hypothetical protein
MNRRLLNRITQIRNHPATGTVLFIAYLITTAAIIGRFASLRPLWYDELFTLHLSQVDSISDLCGHLAAGVDLNPPLSYLCVRISTTIFGVSEWSLRLPSLLGMMVGLSGFYYALTPRIGGTAALLAVSVAVAPIKVWSFFLDARPYGIAFGFAGLAILAWQRASDGHRSAAFTLGIVCALGMATHYYFAMMLIAIAAAEGIRSIEYRRVNDGVWVALACGGVMLVCLRPLWSVATSEFAAGFWAKVTLTHAAIESAYLDHFDPAAIVRFVAIFLITILTLRSTIPVKLMPLSERGLFAVLLLGPVIGVVMAVTITGAFTYRYALFTAYGIGAVVAIIMHRIAHPIGIGIAIAAVLWWGVHRTSDKYREFYRYERRQAEALTAELNDRCRGATVIFESAFEWDRAWHYDANREFTPLFIADPEASMALTGVDTTERALQLLRRLTDVPVAKVAGIDELLMKSTAIYYLGTAHGWNRTALEANGIVFESAGTLQKKPLWRLVRKRTTK